MSNRKYILFDLDGTLTDSAPGITKSVQYALRSMGIEEPELHNLDKFVGPPLKDSFMGFYGMTEEQAAEAIKQYRVRYEDKGMFENSVYPGVRAMLKDLKKRGLVLAVSSSKPEPYVIKILEHFKIAQYFEVIVGSTPDGKLVNKDDIIQETFSRLFKNEPVRTEEIFMVGDRMFDVIGAHKKNVECIGVNYGFGSIEEFQEYHADYIVDTVDELHRFLLRETRGVFGEDGGERAVDFRFMLKMVLVFAMFMVSRTTMIYLGALVLALLGVTVMTANMQAVLTMLSFAVAGALIYPAARSGVRSCYDRLVLTHLMPYRKGILAAYCGVTVLLVLGMNLLFWLTGYTTSSEAYTEVAQSQYSASLILGLLCYGVVTPISEEMMFRGIFYAKVRECFGMRAALIFTTIMFGIYHMNSVQAVYAIILGAVITYGYEYFGEFKIAVLLHMLANIVAYLMGSLDSVAPWFVSVPVCSVTLALGITGLVVLVIRRQRNLRRSVYR